MTDIEEEKAIIDGLINRRPYWVIGKSIGYSIPCIQKRVLKLRRQYGAFDRYSLEVKLREMAR